MSQLQDASTLSAGSAATQSSVSHSVPPPPIPKPEPVKQSQRFEKLDILRGVAVLGILVMNIQSFSMIDAAYFNPRAWGDLSGANYWAWWVSAAFFDLRFMPMFSMLFGAGIALMGDRLWASGRSSLGVHYRRMSILLVFGLIHAYALWYGDILTLYAITGMMVYPLRNLRARTLLWIAILVMLVAALVVIAMYGLFQFLPESDRQGLERFTNPPPEEVQAMVAGYRGSWLDQMPFRAGTASQIQMSYLFGSFLMSGSLMLIGMALYRSGYIVGTWTRAQFARVAIPCVVIGLPLVFWTIYWEQQSGYEAMTTMFLSSVPLTIGGPVMAIGYIGIVMILLASPAMHRIMKPLGAVGQMAFTNYIMQTLICTTIFYGHGFGYFGHIERVGQMLIVLGIWAAQLIYSPIWLRYFRFGPLEWLWRSLTYWKVQPMRVKSPV